METFNFTLDNSITLEKSNADYINECCTNCDVLLNMIKAEVENTFQVKDIGIDQEDWGWYLIFNKDNLNYNLHISYNYDIPGSKEFIFYCFVNKLEKKFLFTKEIELTDESSAFTEKIKQIFSRLGDIRQSN